MINNNLLSLENLRADTREVLLKLANSKRRFLDNFVLVGGSALALRIGHRESEDLDFFSYTDWFNTETISEIRDLLNKSTSSLGIAHDDQFDIKLNGVKVTFVPTGKYSEWRFLKPTSQDNKVGRIYVATIEQIAGMKAYTITRRAKFRDYYDLYVLVKDYMTLDELFQHAKALLLGITWQVFCNALTYIETIQEEHINHLKPKFKVTLTEIKEFFENEIAKYSENNLTNKTISIEKKISTIRAKNNHEYKVK
jgi:predicted nucleotidyltransferase component of viral defense system